MGSGANKSLKHGSPIFINKLKSEEKENYRVKYLKELANEFDK